LQEKGKFSTKISEESQTKQSQITDNPALIPLNNERMSFQNTPQQGKQKNQPSNIIDNPMTNR